MEIALSFSLVSAMVNGQLPQFYWSSAGPVSGKVCVQWLEPSDPHTWNDNYLCTDIDYGLRWSYAGPISGMKCARILETADPHTWHDNYFCAPSDSPLTFGWSSSAPCGVNNVHIVESADPHTWHDNWLCYTYSCPSGFDAVGPDCIDRDECVLGTHACDNNAQCINTNGHYACQCNPGYTGNGYTCTDINECPSNPCDEYNNEICINEEGGYRCECDIGYKLDIDGVTCTKILFLGPEELPCKEAQLFCKNMYGTNLATIRSDEERAMATSELGSNEIGWIGLYSDDVETKWKFRSGVPCPSDSAYKCVDFWLYQNNDLVDLLKAVFRPRCIGPSESGFECAYFDANENGVDNNEPGTNALPFLCDSK